MTTVRYPARAASAIAFLKAHSNDIDVFVEDSAGSNLWLKLLRRFLPDGVRLASVTPLGGRPEVVRACKADKNPDARRRLYIIDADLDIACGTKKPKLRYLYRLRRYCVENYLLQEKAFVEVITALSPGVNEEQAATICDLSGWIERNRAALQSLFTAYATAREMNSMQVTVGYSCHQLFENNVDFNYCHKRTRMRILDLYRRLIGESDVASVRAAYEKVIQHIASNPAEVYSSAKAYILPALYSKSKRLAGFNVNFASFTTMLAQHVDPSVDPFLRRRLAL